MLHFDHVLIAVSNLDEAAAWFRSELGLSSIEGGRHSGLGTGNRIVPLGRDYIELIGVVDRSEKSPLADWVTELSRDRDRPAALCLRTDDIEELSERLGLVVIPMQRERPDGVVLRWKLAGLNETLADPSLPFFIEWSIPDEDHPGRAVVQHGTAVEGIRSVELAGDPGAIAVRLDGAQLDVRITQGPPRVRSVALETGGEPLVIS